MTKSNVIDLFCGCGGFSKGFEQAGFNLVLGLDSWNDAAETYRYNFPQTSVVVEDIIKIDIDELLAMNGLRSDNIDVIIGGPPCQGFSLSGKRLIDDPRNGLYRSFVDIVREVQPKVFVMENVPGMVRLFDQQVKNQIITDFTDIGYNVNMAVLSAEDYGVPQQRKRVFFVGLNRNKINKTMIFSFPMPTHNIWNVAAITCKEAISDLDFISEDEPLPEESNYVLPPQSDYQRLMRKSSSVLFNHATTVHKERTKEIIAMVPDGGNYKDLPKHLWTTRKVNIAWTRMDSNKPCFTIDTGHNHHFHYRANRVPTVRESARIQSFPDTFKFIGIKTSQLKQVGNAVPPILAEVIGREIRAVIERG